MATTIKTKNSTTAATAPTGLVQGELAVNITDKKLYVGDNAGNSIQIAGQGATNGAGGSNTQVQYNSSGALAGSANLTFDGSQLSVYGITVGRGAGAVSSNTAVGTSALVSNTTGNVNTAIGFVALTANTSGVANTAVGRGSLQANTTGGNNVSVGRNSLNQNTTGGYNTAIGDQALLSNTTASNNTAVGYQAAYSNTTGAVTAFGNQSLRANTTGGDLTAIGNGALYSNTTGNYSVALGHSALFSNTTASNNTAVGYQAAYSTTTGSNNTAVGFKALYANTLGSSVAVGWGAAYGTTTGYATAIGYQALYSNTTGTQNTALGLNTLYSNTTGNYNIAVGDTALFSNTTASNNTAVGYQAGYATTTGQYNTFIGQVAGVGNTTGQYNTLIGRGAGGSISTGSKNTVLGCYDGNQGGLDIRTANNYIVLSDGDGNPQAYCASTNVWTFGKGGTGNSNDGVLVINGSTASGYGPKFGGQANGATAWNIGSYSSIYSGTNQYLACVNTSGGVYLNGASATSWTAVSDERQKENLVEITDGASKVASLRAVVGNYIWDEEKVERPFLIAQDVQKVLPQAVTESVDKDGNEQLGVAYTDVIPLLVAAIKELKAEIDLLKGVK